MLPLTDHSRDFVLTISVVGLRERVIEGCHAGSRYATTCSAAEATAFCCGWPGHSSGCKCAPMVIMEIKES